MTQNSVALSLRPTIDQTKWLGRKLRIKKRVSIFREFRSLNSPTYVCLEATLRKMATTNQIINNPYSEAVRRIELRGLNPILFSKAAGNNSDLLDIYRPELKSGNSDAGLPRAVHFAALL